MGTIGPNDPDSAYPSAGGGSSSVGVPLWFEDDTGGPFSGTNTSPPLKAHTDGTDVPDEPDAVVDPDDETRIKVLTAGTYLLTVEGIVTCDDTDGGTDVGLNVALNDDSVGPLYDLVAWAHVENSNYATPRVIAPVQFAANDTFTPSFHAALSFDVTGVLITLVRLG